MKKVSSVEEYVNLFPANQRAALEEIRKAIKSAAPKAAENISYGMPAYKFDGILVYFGGFKNHCSLFPASNSVIQKFSHELDGYTTSKGTIQFPLDQPVPTPLIKKIVKERLTENKIKQKAKPPKKAATQKKTT